MDLDANILPVATTWDWPLQGHGAVVKVIDTPQKFEVAFDAQFFTPNEIDVKVAGNELVIHCSHENRADEHGMIAREVHRAYKLPLDVDPATVKSHLTGRGTLVVTAEKRK